MLKQFRRLLRPTRISRHDLATTTSRALHVPALAETKQRFGHELNPQIYTTGRWLNNDLLHRDARRVDFDFAALCARAVKVCTGATKVVRYEKKRRRSALSHRRSTTIDHELRSGYFGLQYDGRSPPTPNPQLTLIVRSFTEIPVHKVLDWSDDDSSIGTEYIIMEHAAGIQLHEKWPSMSPHQHMLCVKNVSFLMAEMAKLPFPVYGSLYFADAPIKQSLKSVFVEGFCIGPHCGPQYWDCNAGETRFYQRKPPNRGPWPDLEPYCSGLIDAGVSRVPNDHDSQADILPYRGSIKEHLRLLESSSRVIQELAQSSLIKNVAIPTLLHPDIHTRNVFVSEEDPSQVTAIIDWQSTSIEPAFVYANHTPDFVEDPAADIRILEKLMQAEAPHIEAMDETLLRLFRYCDTSWRDGAAALRQELIDISQGWIELGLPGSCPYQPTPEELREHEEQLEDFETAQQLKLFLKRALDAESDGWVPADQWAAKIAENRKLFGEFLESVKDAGGSEERARALWPFGESSNSQ
ncbi:hypothetical protein LEMA_P001480.1 [Plenodomus lingam JN3]|uniref:Altered inheritance of mitochondria protein 9, mitochondrial n=1 Tax=Leptosphaeria maculans (strain JN3 / isolate v23.1.3 / race Av1-4-5-6-7-8) TaxID=985895 RepID=E5ADS2_LEPMJ|nr:hypothetical protein LEMA_P001480.1 [Plenodomus lingam JN3]CBY01361.1 hypothetical protein LEMA_P001480.1 [Plenodomus lingam JN3]